MTNKRSVYRERGNDCCVKLQTFLTPPTPTCSPHPEARCAPCPQKPESVVLGRSLKLELVGRHRAAAPAECGGFPGMGSFLLVLWVGRGAVGDHALVPLSVILQCVQDLLSIWVNEAFCLSHMGLISMPLSLSLSPWVKNSTMMRSVHWRYNSRGLVGLLRSAQCTMFWRTCDVTVIFLQKLKANSQMVILQHRRVIVHQGQL
ncbi:hypothetical protein EYF80_012694 [Liparis tanakae]|uniref:Uncharacterized protein n=1 Tax=Liparis tanakae TaxID=230148 RepID=A0A4Z2IGC3_9TELE|nr:hypothetical protein EYF80_012694 [Liparis tanakae]